MPVIQTRISYEDAENIKEFAKRKGLSTSQVLRESLATYVTNNSQPLTFGCMADKIWIADDFDEMPEGFEEYTE